MKVKKKIKRKTAIQQSYEKAVTHNEGALKKLDES